MTADESDDALDELTLVTQHARNRLNQRQLLDYENHQEQMVKWCLHYGKNPERNEGYSPHTLENRIYRIDQFYRWVWEQEGRYTTDVTTDHASELSEDKRTVEENLDELEDLPDSSDLEDIDDRLQELSEEEGEGSELAEQKESNLGLAKWSISAGVVAFGILLGLGASAIGAVAALAFLGAGVYFWWNAKGLSEEIAELSVKEKNILSDARAAGLSFDDREEIRGEISRIEERRNSLQEENQGKKAVLERELDFEADSMRAVVEQAEEKLTELEESIDDSVDVEYSEQEYDETETAFKEAESRRERLEEAMRDHREKLQEFSERAHQLDFSIFVGERLALEVDNLDALDRLVDRLDEFISAIESDAEASRVAIEIFDEIQEEEREETAELFEEGSRATEIFRQITDGRYSRVTYDNENNQLKVEKSTGETFVPRELSDGTRDQLYLSIRVALGEKMLEGRPGFFIMDDAFLTSDPQRLEIQAEVVEQLAEEGWQIIYLSSKPDAIDELTSRTENDLVELPPLE